MGHSIAAHSHPDSKDKKNQESPKDTSSKEKKNESSRELVIKVDDILKSIPVVTFLHKKFHISHVAALVIGVVACICLIYNIHGSLVTDIVTFLIPTAQSLKLLKTAHTSGVMEKSDVEQMLTYWILFGLFKTLENFQRFLLACFPFYFVMRLAISIWLMHPKTRGASILCKQVLLKGGAGKPTASHDTSEKDKGLPGSHGKKDETYKKDKKDSHSTSTATSSSSHKKDKEGALNSTANDSSKKETPSSSSSEKKDHAQSEKEASKKKSSKPQVLVAVPAPATAAAFRFVPSRWGYAPSAHRTH